MREVLPRVSLRFKENLGSIIGSPTKLLPISLRITRIRCLTLGHKRQDVGIHQVINLLVPSAVRSIGVSGWWEHEISLFVEKRAIILDIFLM